MTQDRTAIAVTNQLKGMGAETYEVGIFERAKGKMIPRQWTPKEVTKSIPWLKSMNFRGHDIYIRPKGSTGLILLDDIGIGTLQRLTADGLKPAVVTITSPLNYQAWLRLSPEPIEPRLATVAAQLLAIRYNADPGSADWRHYGRLAGFTNRKPEYRGANDQHPFVLLDSYAGGLAPATARLLEEALEILETKPRKRAGALATLNLPSNLGPGERAACETYAQLFERIATHYGAAVDPSRVDWAVCRLMLEDNHTPETVAYAMTLASPDLEARKQGHVEDYVTRTVTNMLTHLGRDQDQALEHNPGHSSP